MLPAKEQGIKHVHKPTQCEMDHLLSSTPLPEAELKSPYFAPHMGMPPNGVHYGLRPRQVLLSRMLVLAWNGGLSPGDHGCLDVL